MNGVLVVNKPAGMTSHDVVDIVRRLARTRRVGHTGTLDPMATGVLVLLLGAATRLAQFVTKERKAYRAVIRLGEETATYDAEGETVARHPVTVGEAEVEAALDHFRGTFRQVPPMYAAIKVRGRKLYELAREGKEISRPPRTVTVHRLKLLAWQPPELTITVECSAGTYIRSLAHDLGQALGCGAHLRALTRIANGAFTLADAHPLAHLRALAARGRLTDALLPPRAALRHIPTILLTVRQIEAVRHGQRIALDDAPPSAPYLQGVDAAGILIAVLTPLDGNVWQPRVVLPSARS